MQIVNSKVKHLCCSLCVQPRESNPEGSRPKPHAPENDDTRQQQDDSDDGSYESDGSMPSLEDIKYTDSRHGHRADVDELSSIQTRLMMHQLSSMSIANAWATNADIATLTLEEKEIRLKALIEARRSDNLWKAKIAMDYSTSCKLGTATDSKVVFSSAGVDIWARAYDNWDTQGILNFCQVCEHPLAADNRCMCAMMQPQACKLDQYMGLSDFTDGDNDYEQRESRSTQKSVEGSTADSTIDSASYSMPVRVDNEANKVNQNTLDKFLGCAPAEGNSNYLHKASNQALSELTALIADQSVWANGSCVSPTKVGRKVKRMRNPSDYGSPGMFAYNSASTDWENESCSTICSAEWTRQPMLTVYVPQLKWECKQCNTQHAQVQADIQACTACNASRVSIRAAQTLAAWLEDEGVQALRKAAYKVTHDSDNVMSAEGVVVGQVAQLVSRIKATSALLKDTVSAEAPTPEAQILLTPWQAVHNGNSVDAHQPCCVRCLQQAELCARSMCNSCCEAMQCECVPNDCDMPAPRCQQVNSPTMERMISLPMITRSKQGNTTEAEESHRQRQWMNQTPPQDYRISTVSIRAAQTLAAWLEDEGVQALRKAAYKVTHDSDNVMSAEGVVVGQVAQLVSRIKATSALLKDTVSAEAPTPEAQILLTPWQAVHNGNSVDAHQPCCVRCLQQAELCARSMCNSCCEAMQCECVPNDCDMPAPRCQQVNSPTMERMISLPMITRSKQGNTTEAEESHRQRQWMNQTPPQDYRISRVELDTHRHDSRRQRQVSTAAQEPRSRQMQPPLFSSRCNMPVPSLPRLAGLSP